MYAFNGNGGCTEIIPGSLGHAKTYQEKPHCARLSSRTARQGCELKGLILFHYGQSTSIAQDPLCASGAPR